MQVPIQVGTHEANDMPGDDNVSTSPLLDSPSSGWVRSTDDGDIGNVPLLNPDLYQNVPIERE